MNWCTGFPDGTWAHGCALHDIAYTLQYDKWTADFALGECVARNGGWLVAAIMLAGVCAFGRPAYRKAKTCQQRRKGTA